MKKVLLLSLLCASSFAAERAPMLTGKLEISVKNGMLDADFTLSHIPQLSHYQILLNTGLNIQYFRDAGDSFNYDSEKVYEPNKSSESFGYYLADSNGKKTILPDAIHFKYTGKFPVVASMAQASDNGDWKGNIAFNGKTVRADGLQSNWYPVLYDVDKDKRYEALAYDIEVVCNDCKSIYVNGNKPVNGQKARFSRKSPTELTLFAGDYDIAEYEGSYYLNGGLTAEQTKQLGSATATVEHYYQQNLHLPYGDNVVYINTTPVSTKDSWLFVSFPSIYKIDHDEQGLGRVLSDDYKPFIAHELGHYYSGTLRQFNSPLGDMFNESFTEYLSLKATKKLIAEAEYNKRIAKKLELLADKHYAPFKAVQSNSDYGNRNQYVYNYAAVIWLALEQEIGEEKMWQWLNLMLTSKTERTDYAFMLKTLSEVVSDSQQVRHLEQNYFASKDAIANASAMLKSQTTAAL